MDNRRVHYPFIPGQRFGRLTTISETYRYRPERNRSPKRVRVWLCRCDCGNVAPFDAAQLWGSITRSCGCFSKDRRPDCARTHGRRYCPEYNTWAGMHSRCENPKEAGYKNYGGRGITVCERWRSFENFYADVGDRPSPKHSIDRINNDGNYEPGNVRWATRTEQNRNRRPAKRKKT
jgi:hypothetical protein